MSKHWIMPLVGLSLLVLTSLGVEAAEYGATYAPGAISSLNAGQTITVSVTVTNSGTLTWTPSGPNPFRLAYHWYATGAAPTATPPNYGAVVWNGLRTDLSGPIAPGGKATLTARLQAPPSPGNHTLKWDMIHENVTWFSQRQVPTKDQALFISLPSPGGVTIVSLPLPPFDPSGWPQDRADASRTGWHLWLAPEPKGKVVWRLQVGKMIDSSPVVAPGSGTIYVGTEDTNRALVAINPDGTQKWAIPLGGLKVRATPAIRSDGSLVAVGYQYVPNKSLSGKGYVFLISAAGAVVRISQDLNFYGSMLSAPLLDRGDNAYILQPDASNDRLIKFDRDFNQSVAGGIHYDMTGGASIGDVWCSIFPCFHPAPLFSSDRPVGPSPALEADSNRILLASSKTALIPLEPGRFGATAWEKDIRAIRTPALRSGVAYIPTSGKHVEAWGLDGQRRPGGLTFSGYPLAAPAVGHAATSSNPTANFVYAPAFHGEYSLLFMVDVNAGRVITKPLGGRFAGAPAVLSIGGGQEIVVVANHNGVLWAFRQDGTHLWSVPLGSKALGSPAIVNGRIYVATEDSIIAIQ